MAHLEKIKREGKELQVEVSEKLMGYIGAGFGLIASLAWNEAIKALIEYFFPLKQDTILAKFIYAGVMTLILVVMSVYLVKIFKLQKMLADKKK